jgi:hypothetical protein
MTRDVARRLVFLLLRASSATAAIVVAGGAVPACYPGGGGGTDPPTTTFYFPVGLAVSAGGSALYAVNSDFDLQWNGGTLQSYDLRKIRQDTARLIHANLSGLSLGDPSLSDIEFVNPQPTSNANCLGIAPPSDGGVEASVQSLQVTNPNGTRVALGEICAPPVQSTNYVRSSAIIGAFATDLQIQTFDGVDSVGSGVGHRLFAPVRGNATVTWADVTQDTLPPPCGGDAGPCGTAGEAEPGVFNLDCGQSGNGTPCDGRHQTGNVPTAADTRLQTMPGEPFGLAQTQDGTALAVTHQTETDTSLLLAGNPGPPNVDPSMQFVETDLPNGGSGITFVPHDPDSSVPPCAVPPVPGVSCVRPAFLETNHSTAELDLLRYYDDDGSSLHRPFISKEEIFPFTTNLGGTDSRGIAIDPTPRLACKAMAQSAADTTTCADLPARVFFASRTPPSLVIGEIGGPLPVPSPNGSGSYDPDLLTLSGNIPLPAGPSRVYVAPIVNIEGNYEVRVFVVNFDSSTISIYDPNCGGASSSSNCINLALVDTIYVGPGPFAMAFDPFVLDDVAQNKPVKPDSRQTNLNTYRFGYVASFTQSFVQVIDLDQTQPTFESVVFTLGNPTPPKGS